MKPQIGIHRTPMTPMRELCQGGFGCKCKAENRKRKHGTRSCYQGGCRREECKEAHRKYHRDYNRKKGQERWNSVNATAKKA